MTSNFVYTNCFNVVFSEIYLEVAVIVWDFMSPRERILKNPFLGYIHIMTEKNYKNVGSLGSEVWSVNHGTALYTGCSF